MRYQLGLVKNEKTTIGLIAQTPSRRPIEIPENGISINSISEVIESELISLNEDYGFSGSVLISNMGQIIMSRSVGMASDKKGEMITSETPISMASGSKMFTAVLIAMAVERGMIDWDDKIANLVPELSSKPWSEEITIKNLLTHSSGLPEYWDSNFDRRKKEITDTHEFIPYFINKPLQFSPGEKTEYVNTNFIVLGLILESIFEDSYHNILKRMILDPCGMSNTLGN